MGILDYLFQPAGPGEAVRERFDYVTDQGYPLPDKPTSFDSSDFENAALNVFSAHYLVYACVNTLSDAVASTPLKIYRTSGADREQVREGDLYDLLKRPNGYQDTYEFLAGLVHSLFIGGEGPVELVYNQTHKRPVELHLMRPDNFDPIVNAQKGIVGYRYQVGGKYVTYGVDEVIFLKLANPTNRWRGLSPVSAIRLGVETDLEAASYNRNYFANSAVPGGVLSTEQDLLPRERREILAEWNQAHRGRSRHGKIALVDKGLKFDGTSVSQRDSQWLEGRQHAQEEILVVYRVSSPVLGIVRNVNFSNAEAMIRMFYMQTVRPIMRRFESKLNLELVPYFGSDLMVEFCMDEILRPDMPTRIEALSKAWWYTIDERRKFDNLPALGPEHGGDSITPPVNLAIGGAPVQQQRLLAPQGVTDPTTIAPGNDGVPSQGKERPKAPNAAQSTKANDRAEEIAILAGILTLIYSAQAFRVSKQVMNVVAGAPPGTFSSDEVVDLALDTAAEMQIFADAMRPFVREEVRKAIADVESGGVSTGLTADSPSAVELIHAQANRFAGDVTDTTVAAIRKTLAEGMANGEDAWSLRQRVVKYYAEAKQWRAELAADYETGCAWEQAHLLAAKAAGFKFKRWETMHDRRVEPACLMNEDAGWIPIESAFPTGHHAPLAHPKCRCTVLKTRDLS